MDSYRAAVTDYDEQEDKIPITPAPAAGMDGVRVSADSLPMSTPPIDTPPAIPMERSGSRQSTSTQSTTDSDDSVEDLGDSFLNLLRNVDDLDTTAFNEIHGARHADGSVHYSVVFNPDRIKCPICDMGFANELGYREHRKLACDEPDPPGSASDSGSCKDSNIGDASRSGHRCGCISPAASSSDRGHSCSRSRDGGSRTWGYSTTWSPFGPSVLPPQSWRDSIRYPSPDMTPRRRAGGFFGRPISRSELRRRLRPF